MSLLKIFNKRSFIHNCLRHSFHDRLPHNYYCKMFKMTLVFFINCCTLQAFPGNYSLQMFNDIISSYEQPSSVTAFLCDALESVKFLKSLSKSNLAASVHKLTVEPLPNPFPPNHALFLLDLSCRNSSDLLIRAAKMNLFSSPYRWLIVNNQETNTPSRTDLIRTTFSTIDILVDSEVMIINIVSENFAKVLKIYKHGHNLPLVENEAGFWKSSSGFVLDGCIKITARQRKDLMGTVLKTCIVVTHNDSLNHLTDKRDRHIDTITKVNYVLVQHLGDIVNASLEYSIQSTWGYKDNRSQWSGMIGELQRHEANIGGTPLFVTSDRVSVIDYVAMTSKTRSKFVFRQPKLSYVSNVYVLPFHWKVWVSLLASTIITGVGLYIATKWEWFKKRFTSFENRSNSSELQDSWLDTTMLTFGAVCQQGTSFIPYSIPGRIITILMFITFMFLYTSYSANIVALLQSPSNSIQTLSDLLKSRLDVGVDDTVFNHFYFPNATEPVRRALYLQKVAPPGQKPRFFSLTEGIARMRKRHFAFHMETGVGYKVVVETFEEHEKCGLQEIQFLQVPDPWIALQKNTSYKEMLKIGLRQIHESGIQSRENSLLYTKRPVCANRGSSFASVGIVDCYLVATVLLGGMILSFLVFLLEFGVSYKLRGRPLLHQEFKRKKSQHLYTKNSVGRHSGNSYRKK